MAQQCPLIFRQVDASVTRLNTTLAVLGVGLFFWFDEVFILWFLVLDFVMRLWNFKQFSVLNQLSLQIQKLLKLPVRMVDAGGKRLAAFFGLVFIGSIALAYQFDFELIGLSITLIYIVCALLDIIFDICLACIIYTYFFKIFKPKGQ